MNQHKTAFLLATLLMLAVNIIACQPRAYECKVMHECCKVLRGAPGVGNACNPKMLDGVEKPETCVSVIQSVYAMYDEQSKTVPEQCILRDK